ncbi:MAG: chromosome segregation protein SMC [Clostridia bacterium]|nr:chromosome segregation protein SMC [Clostridia bacterium]
MYLKRLELQGFKSFADKTVLEFMPGITTVIGPNGSGKSNISDSIRWVLGEQSMKSLRGSKSEDIIFAGTQNRKSLGFAEASIVIDNSDGKLPIEYSEATVTRRIYRNGETGYFINKTPCRLKDVLELFMDTGIGKDGYSIIGQGKIDEILSNKSEDRRKIFEEAAGIVKYRTRKAESEKKLEQTKLNLLRINDILSEIEVNIEPLKIQSEKAKKFLDLREELKAIEIGLFIYNIDIYKVKIEELIKDIEIIKAQNEEEEKNLELLNEKKLTLKMELDEITSKVEEMQNLGFESSTKIEKINSEINVTNEKIANNNENCLRYQKEIEEVNLRIKELEEEKVSRIEKKETLGANRERFVTELEEKEKALEEITKKLSAEEALIEEKKREVESKTDLKYEKKELINTQDINYENLEKREKTIKVEIVDTISELDEKRLIKSEISKGFTEIDNKRNECKKRLEQISTKKEEYESKTAEYDNKINNLTSEYRVKESKLKFLTDMEKEKEGYARSVKSLLLECDKNTGLNKGMHGVLANLISVPKEYETAIEMVLGLTLQNIVTDTEEDAKKLIEYLRTNNLGRASFLPISSVKGKKVDKLIKNGLGGVVGLASDLVKVDKKYEDIILNLLGRTVVVEDMDTAIILARQNKYGFKIVTLKGDIINPSGAISGGSVTQKSNGIIGRATGIKELEKDLKSLALKIEKIESEKEKYEKDSENVFEEITGIGIEMQEIEISHATEKQRMISIEETVTRLEKKLESLKTEQEQIGENKQKNREEREFLEKENIEIESLIENLSIEIKNFAEKNKDNQKYIDDLNFDITNLKISLTSFDESSLSLDEIISRIDSDIANYKNSINYKKEESEKAKLENETLKEQIVNLNSEIENIKAQVTNSSNIIEELKETRKVKNENLDKIDTDVINKYKVIEDLKNQISKLDVKKSKLDFELEQTVNKMWEDYEVTPNGLNDEYKKPENVAKTTKKVKELRDEIKSLGSINIDSIEEYKQTKERYDFMSEQRLDLETSSTKLKKVIADITKTMKEQFSKQFKVINKNFGEVFKELFDGGQAELKLIDEENILECGIEIEVQPPGKKLQSMSLLSGGEKALTAIALLFAILKINPAPFCVLDEIEAALDDVNVYRFADYLKKFTKDVQFLVITHRKGTMEAADTVYGITMEENGVSKLLSMKLDKR